MDKDNSEFEKAKNLLNLARKEAKQGNIERSEALESEAAAIANGLGFEGGRNPFSVKETPMLHRQFVKGLEGRAMIEKGGSTVEDSIYQEVSADLRRSSKTLSQDDKAIKAGALADRISAFSQNNPAPKKLQSQLFQYRDKRQELTANLLKQAEKGEELGV